MSSSQETSRRWAQVEVEGEGECLGEEGCISGTMKGNNEGD